MPHPGAIFGAVVITAVFSALLFFYVMGEMQESYRAAHDLPPVWTGSWVFGHYKAADVSFEQLGIVRVLALVAGQRFMDSYYIL